VALTSALTNYDPIWEIKFSDEKSLILKLLEADIASIHHVGSTSVTGLVAKPEIDILIIIDPKTDLNLYITKLEMLGYVFRGEEAGPPGHWYFRKNQENQRTHKLHLCIEGHPCIEEQIIFRNYLRDNPIIAKEYGDLKLQLERENTKGIIEYLEKKSPFILRILETAKISGYQI
jgi:GrpB-like predicted nucleotidyltransferase (UPF0157 family)